MSKASVNATSLLRRAAMVLWIIGLFSPNALAQSTFGTILGMITDPSGARVPEAKVVVTNQYENTSRVVQSDGLGSYEVDNLKAGMYTVTVSKAGFKDFSSTDLSLVARQTLRVNVVLEVGAVGEKISVTATPTVLNSETAATAASFSSTDVLSLPMTYRASGSTSPYTLLDYLPGVQSDDSWDFSLYGGKIGQADFSVDGISSINIAFHSPIPDQLPSVESIGEMRVQAVGNNAEFDDVGDITITTKSGSNDFHGSLFDYFQNRALDATNFGSVVKPQKTANTFGGSLGGHLVKDRAFFFGDFEGMRFRSGTTIQDTVPTAAMRSGDFSAEGVTVMDPLTNQPFANDQIPSPRVSSIAQQVLGLYPLPNYGETTSETPANFRQNYASPISSNQFDVRVDYVLTRSQSVFGRFTWKNTSAISPNILLLPPDNDEQHNRGFVISHNYTIKPTLLNEFRVGLSRNLLDPTWSFDGASFLSKLGLQGLGPNLQPGGMTAFKFSGLTDELSHDVLLVQLSRNLQLTDNLTWLKGRHTMKFGVDVRHFQVKNNLQGFSDGDDYGQFNFLGTFSGSDFADFLLGLPGQSVIVDTGPPIDATTRHYSFYAQDSFRASSKFTLEFGLRYEYHPPFLDSTFNMTNFDRSVPVTGRVIVPNEQSLKEASTGFLTAINACPGPAIGGVPCTPIVTAQQAGWPESLRWAPKKDFGPRLGFAYRPLANAKLVIRGGAGIYTMPILGDAFGALTAVHTSNVTQYTNSIQNGVPLWEWPQTAVSGAASYSSVGTEDFRTIENAHMRDPYAEQWNLTVERDLGWGTGLRVAYTGLESVHLVNEIDLNQPQPSTTPFSLRPLTDRPFPNWNALFSLESDATASYNALEVEVKRNFRSGLGFTSTWSWAKHLVEGPATFGYGGERGDGTPGDSSDRRAERGNEYGTRRHRWVTTAIYELPVGRGRHFARSATPILDGVIGGWRLSSILLLETGPFMTPLIIGDPSGTNGIYRGIQRPDAVHNGNLAHPTAQQWWDQTAFACPGQTPGGPDQFNCFVTVGRFGNAGPGTLVGPGTVNLNMGLGKEFKIQDRAKLKFEASFTNLPNHLNLGNPFPYMQFSVFGLITSARGADAGGSRVGQFALRLEF